MVDAAIREEFASYMKHQIKSGAYRDASSFSDRIASEVTMYTPRFWRPITDRDWMMGILSMVPQAIEEFTYHRHWTDGDDVIMEFKGHVGDKKLHGIDIFTLNEQGQISELTVMIRPPNGLAALGEREDALLQEMFGVTSQDEHTASKQTAG